MNVIVAVDMNLGIGYKGSLLYREKRDMENFKKITTGKVVVMGRNTFESLPNKRPLPNRQNIILTTDITYNVDNAIIVHSFNELDKLLLNYNSDDIFIIGGSSLYNYYVPKSKNLYITYMKKEFKADTFFRLPDSFYNWNEIFRDTFYSETHNSYYYITLYHNSKLL